MSVDQPVSGNHRPTNGSTTESLPPPQALRPSTAAAAAAQLAHPAQQPGARTPSMSVAEPPVSSASGAPDPENTAPVDQGPTAAPATGKVPRTRLSAAWIGLCAAALVSIVLIIFMLQNTRGVEVTFLWMHGSLPLALALLIAGVGSALVTMVIGGARITQLRRLSRRSAKTG